MSNQDNHILTNEEIDAILAAAVANPLTIEELLPLAGAVDFNMDGMTRDVAHSGIIDETSSMLEHLDNYLYNDEESKLYPELKFMDEETLLEWKDTLILVKFNLFMPSATGNLKKCG
ncbi:MAG: hypothetical protein ACI9QD_000570 [Thermoproteota archaeon]|jgi:hypothetical protein